MPQVLNRRQLVSGWKGWYYRSPDSRTDSAQKSQDAHWQSNDVVLEWQIMTDNGSAEPRHSHTESKDDSRLIAALAGGASITNAAKTAHVSQRTVYRRLQNPDFRRQVADARGQFIAAAMGKLAEASTRAVETLLALLKSDSDSIKLGAARSILEYGSRLRETVELEQRVCELESRFLVNGKLASR